MSLNNIQFPASAIADLYPTSLIETNEVAISTEISKATPGDDKYLGENKKNILVIADYADVMFLPDEEFSFLTNMLAA